MKVFAENRKARNSYEFLDFYEAGVVLSGPETKSVRSGGVSIVDAFAIIDKEEAYIMEMNIEPYKYSDNTDYIPKSQRKLLLHKSEIKKLLQTLNKIPSIDVLVNKAGSIFDNRTLTKEGVEKTFALNHLSYMQLSLGLLSKLENSADPRIVNVSSNNLKQPFGLLL